MTAWSGAARARGERIAFVPTMGALHEGHVSLLREGRRRGDRLVLSIFVNPTQFGPPRIWPATRAICAGDLAKAAGAGTDVAFVPDAGDVYPPGFQTYVQVRELEQGLCGASRPDHFVGVATVVCKLFNIVRPARRALRREGLPAARRHPPHGRRPRHGRRDRRHADRARARRPGDVVAQRLPVARRARTRPRAVARLFAARDAQAGERDARTLVATARGALAGEVDRVDYVELRDAPHR